MSVPLMPAWCPWRPEEDVRSSGIGVTDGDELPCGCWESNLDPLEEQPVLLTIEPSLQTRRHVIFVKRKGPQVA